MLTVFYTEYLEKSWKNIICIVISNTPHVLHTPYKRHKNMLEKKKKISAEWGLKKGIFQNELGNN